MSWTEEKVNKLKELWGKGNTASQIAEVIGGITRNAVIGKAHRLNLSAKIKTRAASSKENLTISISQYVYIIFLVYTVAAEVSTMTGLKTLTGPNALNNRREYL